MSVVPKVTCDLPLQGAAGVKDHPHIKDLALADSHFDRPGRIDLLIGCNLFPNILTSDIRRGSAEQPTAMKTTFGWAIMGPYRPIVEGASLHTTSVCNVLPMSGSDALLRKFWETEEVSISSPCHTPEEKQVVKHFEANHTFLPTGRYQVMLCPGNQTRLYWENHASRLSSAFSPMRKLPSERALGHSSKQLSMSTSNWVTQNLYLPQNFVSLIILHIISPCTQSSRRAALPRS